MDSERLALVAVEAADRVPVPAAFAVAREVELAALDWPTHLRYRHDKPPHPWRQDICCNACGQSIAVLVLKGQSFEYTPDQVGGLLVAHVIQAHHWTRETIGDAGSKYPVPERWRPEFRPGFRR
jgi:hypothetical protein